jgi:hypothetical protein
MKKLIMFTLVIICSSCSFEQDGLVTLRELCEKDAGLTIYKTAEADGYYDATTKGGALRLLIPSNFNFMEYCNLEPNIASLFKEAGCWRLTKIPRKNGQCNETIDKILWRYDSKGYFEFKENYCIAVKKIEKPKAKYRYEIDIKQWWLNESAGTEMTSYTGKILNNKTEEIIGTAKNYILRPKEHNSPPTIHCGSYNITGLKKTIPFAKGLIEKTLLKK